MPLSVAASNVFPSADEATEDHSALGKLLDIQLMPPLVEE